MSEFNIKAIRPSVPQQIYEELNQCVAFGDRHVTARTEHDGQTGYLLGGLLVKDILETSLSEDTIGKLSNALDNDNVRYALFPNDIRLGQLPLILTDGVRNYIKSNLPELIESKNVHWRVFFLPDNIDPDDNEMACSEVLVENNEPISLDFNELETYFHDHGEVLSQTDEDMFDDSVENPTDSNENTPVSKADDDVDHLDDDNDLPDVNSSSFDFSEDEIEAAQGTFSSNDTEENEKKVNKNEDKEASDSAVNISSTEQNPLNNLSEEDEENPLFETQVHETLKETNSTNAKPSNETNKATMENDSEDTNELDDMDDFIDNQDGLEHMAIPNHFKEMLDTIYIGQFNDFPKDNVYKDTSELMRKEIKNANEMIKSYNQDIKRGAIMIYEKYMDKSYKSLKAATDSENGNKEIQNRRFAMEREIQSINQERNNLVDKRKKELEEYFFGERLEEFKQQILSTLRQKHIDENYENEVDKPLAKYENKIKPDYDERVVIARDQFNTWVQNIEETAKTRDQNQAIEKAAMFIETKKAEAKSNVEDINKKLLELNDNYIKLESQHRANENLRETLGSDLLTDEEAQAYKEKLKQAADKKAKLESDIEELKKSNEQRIKDIESSKNDEITQIKSDHDSIIEKYEKEKSELNSSLEKTNSEREKLTQRASKQRNKTIGTGIGAFVLSGLIFGGVALGINSHNHATQEQIDKQEKIANEQKSKVKSTEKDLEKLKKDNQKQQDKIKEQQKEIDKKDKKDKKKK